jgi:hypothetical protein
VTPGLTVFSKASRDGKIVNCALNIAKSKAAKKPTDAVNVPILVSEEKAVNGMYSNIILTQYSMQCLIRW